MANSPRPRNLAPVDPDTSIPPAVRRAAEAADAAMRASKPEPPASAPAANDGITIAPVEPPQRLPNAVTTTESAPPPPPQPDPPPQPNPEPPPPAANEWEARYNAMYGQFRKASKDLSAANARIEALENMLATTQRPAAPAPAPQPPQRLITEQEEKDFGPEMIDLMRRVARETAGSDKYNELMNEVQQLRAQVQGTAQTVTLNAKQRMHQTLDTELPNWDEINHSDDFHAWLGLRDPFSGVTRKKLLVDAYGNNETDRVLAIFNSFVSETAATRTAPPLATALPPTAPVPQAPSGPTLEALAAPGRARTAASPTPAAEKQIIRTSDVNRFYADVRRGAYRGREELQKQYEAELFAAMSEGRIVTDT